MNKEDSRNLIMAIALSILVLVGWNFFFPPPKPAPEPARTAQSQSVDASKANPSVGIDAPKGAAAGGAIKTRAEALAATARVTFETPSLKGSISLVGGVIDDVVLKGYRETVDPTSPFITLLSPQGGPKPYWAETGFVGDPGGAKMPNRETLWTADSDKLSVEKPVTLTWDGGAGVKFKRVIALDDKYMFTVTDRIENAGGAAVNVHPYALILRRGRPEVAGYSVFHEGFVGDIDDKLQEVTYASLEKETGHQKAVTGVGGWLGFTDKYWASAIIPDQNAAIEARFSSTGDAASGDYQADYVAPAAAVAPGANAEATAHIFAGAKKVSTIEDYKTNLGIKRFDLMIDWGWFYFFTKPLFRLMDLIYNYIGNFGVSILIVTVLVKAAFFPLANRSYTSMARMKAIQPKIEALKQRFGEDRAGMQQAQMELFKKEGVNPVTGCLPQLIQIPVFFALYKVIFVTIEMRHAPFFGWIKDLSAPDPTNVFNLFGLIPFDPTTLPGIGHFLAIGIWPLIMGFSMFVQMKMNPEPADPTQKAMFAWMPVIFTFMLGTFPAGLVIYWTWNNTLTVLQQYLILRRTGGKFELWDNLTKMFRGARA